MGVRFGEKEWKDTLDKLDSRPPGRYPNRAHDLPRAPARALRPEVTANGLLSPPPDAVARSGAFLSGEGITE